MENPAMTLVGSPNFGYRSSERDLEAQVIMVTDNAKLQESLGRVRGSIPYEFQL
jgi:CDP-diacylglycerol---glycerol-3-phosphate 3-phosphatidyltransferase